jgi:splicing factor 3B subunit 4
MAAAASNNRSADRNTDATVHIGQLDERVTDDLLYELCTQVAPVKHVYVPRERITGAHYGYGFCEFKTELDAAYASKVLNMTTLFSKPIRLAQSSADRHHHDVGANLFVGNLAPSVDEKLLYDAFSAFGPIADAPHIMRDPDTNENKGYGFVKYSAFEASDAAVATMNGQYIANRPVLVQYAFKKDGAASERHGSEAERALAAASASATASASSRSGNPALATLLKPNTLFADRPVSAMPPPQPAAHLYPAQLYQQPLQQQLQMQYPYMQPPPPGGHAGYLSYQQPHHNPYQFQKQQPHQQQQQQYVSAHQQEHQQYGGAYQPHQQHQQIHHAEYQQHRQQSQPQQAQAVMIADAQPPPLPPPPPPPPPPPGV